LDVLIQRAENPDWWRTVRDELNNENIVLSKEQLMILERIRSGHFAGKSTEHEDV